jgi:polysaccharide biosynthesis transport protein
LPAPSPNPPGQSDGGSILGLLRRRALIIVVTTLLVGGAAAAFAYVRRSTYQTTAELLFSQTIPTEVNALGLIPPTTNADKLAADNAAFVASRRVAALTARLLGDGTSVDSIQKDINVATPKTSDVVDVVATAHSADRAAHLARVYTNAVVELARGDESVRTGAIIAALKSQLHGLRPNDPAAVAIRTRIAGLSAIESAGTDVPRVIQAGYVPTGKAGRPLETVGLGLLFGLLLGLGLALLREQTDARLRHPQAVSAAFDAPVLATVPNHRLLTRNVPFAALPGELSAPFHMVLAHLRYGASKPIRSVLVTSAGARQDKTTVAWNLAAAAAASGMSVVLLDADLRHSNLASRYDLEPSPGLSEVLRGEASLADAVQRVPTSENGALEGRLRRLGVLTAGAVVPEPAALLQSGEMTELLAALRHHELLVINAGAIARQSDSISLIHRVDGVLVTAPLNSSRSREAQQLRTQLDALGAHVIGVVATGGGRRAGGYVEAARPTAITNS